LVPAPFFVDALLQRDEQRFGPDGAQAIGPPATDKANYRRQQSCQPIL
jgi:hypothetical protein